VEAIKRREKRRASILKIPATALFFSLYYIIIAKVSSVLLAIEAKSMRKITREAVEALENGREYRNDNTAVYKETTGATVMELHGNKIARNYCGITEISTQGWTSNTTLSRLRYINGVQSLVKKGGVLFLNGKEWDGKWIMI